MKIEATLILLFSLTGLYLYLENPNSDTFLHPTKDSEA